MKRSLSLWCTYTRARDGKRNCAQDLFVPLRGTRAISSSTQHLFEEYWKEIGEASTLGGRVVDGSSKEAKTVNSACSTAVKVRGVHLRCLRPPPLSLGASPLSCRPCAVASYSYCGSPVAGSLCCCIIAWGRFFSLRHARRGERSSRSKCFIPFFPFILFSYFIMYLMHVTLVSVCVCVRVCVYCICVLHRRIPATQKYDEL